MTENLINSMSNSAKINTCRNQTTILKKYNNS
jgi:hypothetical protein